MTQREYEQWKAGKWKKTLRNCRRYFQSEDFGCFWPDAANDISFILRHPEKIEDSVFALCKTF